MISIIRVNSVNSVNSVNNVKGVATSISDGIFVNWSQTLRLLVVDSFLNSQVVVGTKQDLERVDLPFEEIEATVRIVSIMMVIMMRRRRFFLLHSCLYSTH